jgi:hypothetical protein
VGTKSTAKPPRLSRTAETVSSGDAWALSKSQLRELRRRTFDLEDRTRYLLVSVFTPRFALYYNVSNDTFGMNDPSLGTLFKRRVAAVAIQRLLRTGIQVVQCRADRHDRVIKSSLPRLRPTRHRASARRRSDWTKSQRA